MDISQTNLANFGTELEFKIKQASAESEPCFSVVSISGTYVFRVNKFKLEEVPPDDDVANFFSGDSYVVASIDTHAEKYLVFYWIGSETTIDEAGVAAYKAFELDNVLKNKAVQYRETCGNESQLFRSLFPAMRILSGGYNSGFRHVEAAEFKSRLFRVYSDHLEEITGPINSSHQYLYLTKGPKLYQWCDVVAAKYNVARNARYLDDAFGGQVQIIVVDEWNRFVNFCGVSTTVGTTKNVSKPKLSLSMIVKYVGGNIGGCSLSEDSMNVSENAFTSVNEVGKDGGIYLEIKNSVCFVYGKLPLAGLCANEYLKNNKSISACTFMR